MASDSHPPSAAILRTRLARHLVRVAVSALVAVALSGCSAYPWRPATGTLASVAATGSPLRVTTRPSANAVTYRYVLAWARVAGDSLIGVVREEYQSVGAGGWRLVPQTERERRVAMATADIVDVSRREPEPSATRTLALLLGLTALAYAVVWAALHPRGDT